MCNTHTFNFNITALHTNKMPTLIEINSCKLVTALAPNTMDRLTTIRTSLDYQDRFS